MKNIIKKTVWISLLLLPSSLFAWSFIDLWQTADQQGATLLQAKKAEEASKVFLNKDWKAVAMYRSGNYASAFQQFNGTKTSDGQYNAGNAAAYLGRYQEAINSYEKAIALNPNNTDAITNRELIKKLMNEKKQSQKNSSDNTEKDKNNNLQDKSREQNNSSFENNAEKNNAKNNEKKDSQEAANQSTQENHSPEEQEGRIENSLSDNQPLNSKKQSKTVAGSSNNQNEDKNQLLRRLTEDPGGLLRQKFMRDYLRRHTVGNKD